MKRYPFISKIEKNKKNPTCYGICKICGKNKSDRKITVEVCYMRGDDKVFSVHQECFDKIDRDVKTLIKL